MRKKVRNTLRQFQMVPKGARLVIGLSGGADSVALLHVLHSLQKEFAWDSLTAVHIHHGLRVAAADEDARFAEGFCADLGIPCIVKHYDVRAEAKARGLGEEEMGRLLRYAAFRQAAGEDGCIAVAHHRRDQAETVLMRLCRGTGLKGLAGMAPVRENICRPLLFCDREEIEDYCRENRLEWREDATNREEAYTRNKLRLRVLPILEEINPQAVAHIAKTASLLAEEEDFLEQQTALYWKEVQLPSLPEEVSLSIEGLNALHPAMRRRILRQAVGQFQKKDISAKQLAALEDLLRKESGKQLDFPEGLRAENRYGTLVLSRRAADAPRGFCYALPLEEEIFIPEAGIAVLVSLDEKKVEISAETCTNVFDYDKIEHTLFCRTRRQGDVIPLRRGRKKIKELFIDAKIPRAERERYPLFVAGHTVIWVPRLKEAFGADEQTDRKVWIQIRRVQE